MYHRAQIYDLLYSHKDYEAEANHVFKVLEQRGIGSTSSLLEAGCGTCSHLRHFAKKFEYVSGFDLYDEMIQFAETKFDVSENRRLFKADMIDLDVNEVLSKYTRDGKPFDAIVSLFGCVGYILGEQRLTSAFRNFYNLVREGGIVVIETYMSPDDFQPDAASMETHDGEDFKIARISKSNFKYTNPQGEDENNQVQLHFNFMVATNLEPGDVDHFMDVHEMQLHSEQYIKRVGEAVGFTDVQLLSDENYKNMYVMTKPESKKLE
ncbi:class I SAM-dependent methyltransferase [Acrasis kona]|uniref:Class I SAM-dependent methyltransferase n=1 Tax=Acrasis kona TaxID=1008807 RepID=A0AAW2ZBJ0_9EUKA